MINWCRDIALSIWDTSEESHEESAQGQGQVTTDLCCEGGRQWRSSVDIRLYSTTKYLRLLWRITRRNSTRTRTGEGKGTTDWTGRRQTMTLSSAFLYDEQPSPVNRRTHRGADLLFRKTCIIFHGSFQPRYFIVRGVLSSSFKDISFTFFLFLYWSALSQQPSVTCVQIQLITFCVKVVGMPHGSNPDITALSTLFFWSCSWFKPIRNIFSSNVST